MAKRCLIIHVENRYGGSEISLIDIINNVSEKSKYVVLLSSSSKLYMEMERGLKTYLIDIRYIKKEDIRRKPFSTISNILRNNLWVYKICRKENISSIYCNTHRSLIYVPKILLRKCKVVCSCRDNINTAWEKLLIRFNSTIILPVSEHISRQLPNINKLVVPNIINTFSINYSDGRTASKNDHPLKIANIGSIQKWKNQFDFLEIAKRISTQNVITIFYLIGDVQNIEYYSKLKEFIRVNQLESKVIFTGFVKNINDTISNMDIIVHTADKEPYGRIIPESMLMGKVVISYDCGGPAEIIINGKNGFLVKTGDIESASQIIYNLSKNLNKRKVIGEQARKYILSTHDIKKYVHDLESLLLIG